MANVRRCRRRRRQTHRGSGSTVSVSGRCSFGRPLVRVGFMPMASDVDATAEPYLFMTFSVFDKTLERGQTRRTADQSAVQADRQHLRCFGAFSVKHIECIFEVLEEIVALVETLDLGETHVVEIGRASCR